MPKFDVAWVVQACGGLLRGQVPQEPFLAVSTDSRNIGKNQLFIALSGRYFNGHDYVAEAFAAGATGAIVHQKFVLPTMPEACLIKVSDPLFALGELARYWRDKQDILVVGITGSNGKTTTKEMLVAILNQSDHRVLATQGNLNNLIGLPLTLMQLNKNHSICVLEMGMNSSDEIFRLAQIAKPRIGLITNVGIAHIGMLGGSINAIARAKIELYKSLSSTATAVINMDDPLLRPYATNRLACRVVGFSLYNKDINLIHARDLVVIDGCQAFTLSLPGQKPMLIRLGIPGRHNVANALAAAAIACVLEIDPEAILFGLENFKSIAGRLNVLVCPGFPTIVDDTYNANPSSLVVGLETLIVIASGRRRVLILGDMLELGDYSSALHRDSGRQATYSGIDLVLALGQYAKDIVEGACEAGLAKDRALAFTNISDLLVAIKDLIRNSDILLVKGSRAMIMERVVKALTRQNEIA